MSNHKNTPLIKKIQEQYNLYKKLGIKLNKSESARKLGIGRQLFHYHLRVNVKK